ncbi:hypothetical protein C2E23DRAFT_887627 [Lenzites betulinus]|nr:hypothetical protein C2E23DRAFT_887627 [Lenzites betulinus]
MTTHSPTRPLALSVAQPAPPVSVLVATHGVVGRKPSAQAAKRSPSPRAEQDTRVPNPVNMFNNIIIHPVAWPMEALRWMGVPHTLPATPSPATTPSSLPKGAMSASARKVYGRVASALQRRGSASYEEVGALVVEAFSSMADVQHEYIYRRAKAYLALGDMKIRMEPMHGFSGRGVAPVLAYVDEPFRRAQRDKLVYSKGDRGQGVESVQDNDHVAVMDVAMLLAMAQEHKRWGIHPDTDGNHTSRVMYPNNSKSAMIVLTAVTAAETLRDLQTGAELIKPVSYSRRTIPIVSDTGSPAWEKSPLLHFIWTLVEEGGRLSEKAPTPRWAIGPWAWTTHL